MNKLNIHKYEDIWKPLIPNIIESVREGKSLELNMNNADFKAVGKRKNYSFRLEIENNTVKNNIDGSALARDLARILTNNTNFSQALNKRTVLLRLDKKFTFKMEIV
ncbi:hypothetical protein ABWH96_03440 [Marivirga tractuosa]|uniref:hypothetical protein n=1 Tax=Marivirga tractuosa TaxID=1006 RepID=UPI0035D0878D